VTHQLSESQKILGEMNQQLNRMIQSGTRIVGKQEATLPNSIPTPGDVLVNIGQQLTQQFTNLQRVFGEINQQFNRMIQSGTRLVGKQEATLPSMPSAGDFFLNVGQQLTQQFTNMQRVFGEMNQQFNRMIQSGTRLLGKQDATSVPTPGDLFISIGQQMTQQFTQMQRIFGEMNQEFNRMIQTGTRAVTGDGTIPSVGEVPLAIANQLNLQFAQAQRVFGEMNQQFNRMIESGTRLLG